LAAGHFAGRVLHADFVQEWIGEGVVELQWDADQEGSEGEDGEISVFEEAERFGGEDVAELESAGRGSQRGRVR
jgi:hypothetical protein